MSIPTYSPGELVSMAWDRGEELAESTANKSRALLDQAMGQAGAAPSMTGATFAFNPQVTEPGVFIPQLAEGASMEMFETWWDGIINRLGQDYSQYIDRFFPNECDYFEKAQQWICNAIENGGTGIAPRVEEQIWERDRARILRDSDRAEQEITSNFAGRGYVLPPGAMVGGILRVRNESQSNIAQSSRERAIQQAQIEIENVRLAVSQAIELRMQVTSAARDYIATLAGTSGVSAQLIPSITDSQSRLISAASGFYQARIAVKDLELKATTANAGMQQTANEANQRAQMQAARNLVDAAIEGAKMLATQSAAALNALNTSTSTSASANNSVGYSYSNDTDSSAPTKTVT